MKRTLFSIAMLSAYALSAQSAPKDIKTETTIDEVELFGVSSKTSEGLEVITRMPLKTRDQIQSISVLSSKVIEDLGGLTLTDVVKNIPGVTQFGSYGGVKESMSIRGYRGVPVLKNGVRMDSDFRTGSMLTEMQGVEAIQVIKGSAAITQGIAGGLGDAGGVINVVTKKPHFVNRGSVGLRVGSYDLYRGFFDVERVLDANKKVAVRLNGAYQENGSFRSPSVKGDRIYVNPSLSFRPDDKTEINVEMDYFHANVTPDRGTINLSADDQNHLYEMPKGKFLGFFTDNSENTTFNFSTTATRHLTDKLKLRAAYFSSSYQVDNISSSLGRGAAATGYAVRTRSLARSERDDKNQVFQFDFIGQDLYTGKIKHTMQVGFDWSGSKVNTYSYQAKNNIDQINVLESISNVLPQGVNLDFGPRGEAVYTENETYGILAQDVIALSPKFKATLGLRYSHLGGQDSDEVKDAWNPSVGLMYSPRENMNIFGSYTSTTSLRGANNPLLEGGIVGSERTDQFEAGLKSDWFDEKLRFNVTLFHMNTDNLSYNILNEQGQATGFYGLAGKLLRSGVDLEVIGRIQTNLSVMAGYAYLNAEYKDSPAYMDGSAPMNTPTHTANAWANYKFNDGAFRGLDAGVGVYYVGARPVDNFTKTTIQSGHVNSVEPGVKPFDMKAYTTLEAQVGYQLRNLGLRLFLYNLTDAIGYSSYYRGGYLDQIAPRSFSVQLTYKF